MNTGRVRIGHGTYGTVFETKHKEHGDVVMKWIDITNGYKHPLELDIMIRFNHPNIMRCLEYHPDHDGDKEYISVVMEKASKDLHTYRLRNKSIRFEYIRSIMHDCLSGLKALHDEDLIHLDIKSNNIVIFDGQHPHAKLIDFGMSKKLYNGSQPSKHNKIISEHNPPENTNGSFKYGKYTDIWGMGMTFLFLLSGNYISRHELTTMKTTTFSNVLKCYSTEQQDLLLPLLHGMLTFNQNNRYNVDQLLRLPIFNNMPYVPNIIHSESIMYGTYDINECDKKIFNSWFAYISSLRPEPRTICNAIEIYHRYMRLCQDNDVLSDKIKAYTLTAATCISFMLNEDIKLQHELVYTSIIGYHLCIEMDYPEVKKHIITVNMYCQNDISRSPLHKYVCDRQFTYDNYYHILSNIHDPIEYSRYVDRSPSNNEESIIIPKLNYSMIKVSY